MLVLWNGVMVKSVEYYYFYSFGLFYLVNIIMITVHAENSAIFFC